MRVRIIILILFLLIWPVDAYCEKRLHREGEYQECWCTEAGGVTEYVLPDRTRIDCLTDEYAIEFDFAEKWAEAIGQSLHYAEVTNKKPGIVLIIEVPKDKNHLNKLKPIAKKIGIKIWIMKPSEICD